MCAQLRKWGAPEKLLKATLDTPPSSMKFFNVIDLVNMGAVRLGEKDSSWSWFGFSRGDKK